MLSVYDTASAGLQRYIEVSHGKTVDTSNTTRRTAVEGRRGLNIILCVLPAAASLGSI